VTQKIGAEELFSDRRMNMQAVIADAAAVAENETTANSTSLG
jgi:hypothetical protein